MTLDLFNHQSTAEPSKRNAGIDALRLFAALLVVMVHCRWDMLEYSPWLSQYWAENLQYYIKIASFLGVPIFFAISGYYSHKIDSPRRVFSMMWRLVVLYIVMAGSLALVNLPLWTITEGVWPQWSRVVDEIIFCRPMWFIRDMFIYIPVIYLLNTRWPSFRKYVLWLLLPVILLNYFVGNLWEDVFTVTLLGIPMLMLGMALRDHGHRLTSDKTAAIILIAVGLLACFVEVAWRIEAGNIEDQVYLLASPLIVAGLMILCVNHHSTRPKLAEWGRRYSAWIYALHPCAIVVSVYIILRIYGEIHWASAVANLFVAFLLPIIIVNVWERLRLKANDGNSANRYSVGEND